jgi:serine/threonine protein kinase
MHQQDEASGSKKRCLRGVVSVLRNSFTRRPKDPQPPPDASEHPQKPAIKEESYQSPSSTSVPPPLSEFAPEQGGSTLHDTEEHRANVNKIDFLGPEPSQRSGEDDDAPPCPSSASFISNKASPAQEQLLPDTIPCSLIVIYDHKPLGEPQEIPIKWNFSSSFQCLEEAAEDRLRSEEKDSASQLYMKSGRCCLMNDETKKQYTSKVLEFQRQWPETVAFMVTSFWSQHPDDAFHLEIRWEFSGLEIHRQSNQLYADTIRAIIQDKMLRNWENKLFIPRKDLDAIMSEATVAELIRQDRSLWKSKLTEQNNGHPLDKKWFIEKVYGFACKLLAIFVYVDLPLACLHQLICSGIEDINLPLKDVTCPFSRYLEPKWIQLLMVQGGFIAHSFKDDKGKPEHDDLEEQIVVPVIKHKKIGEGSFGEVFDVSIDSDHHFFSNDKTEHFALKQFFDQGSRTRGDFQNESKMLGVLSKIPHMNITRHLALWTQKDRFYMLFPRAEKNLRMFIADTSHPTLSKDTVLWLLNQFKGLADGVRQIHNLGPSGLGPAFLRRRLEPASKRGRTGFHHDLKPENILVFADDDASTGDPITGRTWKISDFGSARIGLILSGSGMQEESYFTDNLSHGDAVYGAPDFVLEGKTSRPYDMWSLGCIFLQCLLWVLGTPGSGLQDFAADRLVIPDATANQDSVFWYVGSDGHVRLKPAVVTKLKDLRQDCEGRGVLKLLVSSIGKLLTIKPSQRTDAPNLFNELDAILTQAEIDLNEDPNYYLQKDYSRKDGQVAAPPTTIAEDGRHSIDERSIHAPHGRHLVPTPRHHRSSSGASILQRRSRLSDNADSFQPATLVNHRKMPSLPNGSSSLSPVKTHDLLPASSRSRSPSISVSTFGDTPSPLQDSAAATNGTLEASPPVGWQEFPFRHDDYQRPRRSNSQDSRGSFPSVRSFTFPQ